MGDIMYKYKTKDGNDTFIPGVGTTVNGHIEAISPIENPNLVLISRPDQVEQAPAPTHLNGVAPQSAQPVSQADTSTLTEGAHLTSTDQESENK